MAQSTGALNVGPAGLALKAWALVNTSAGAIVAQSGGWASSGGGAGDWAFSNALIPASCVCIAKPNSGITSSSQVVASARVNGAGSVTVSTYIAGVATGMLCHVEVWG